MDLGAVMDGIATRLRTIAGLRTFAYPADRVEVPAAVVGFPTAPFDFTLRGTSEEWTFPVWVLVNKVSDRASRDALAAYVTPSGVKSVKAAIEADKTLGGICDSVRVTQAQISVVPVAGTEYLAAEFQIDVVG